MFDPLKQFVILSSSSCSFWCLCHQSELVPLLDHRIFLSSQYWWIFENHFAQQVLPCFQIHALEDCLFRPIQIVKEHILQLYLSSLYLHDFHFFRILRFNLSLRSKIANTDAITLLPVAKSVVKLSESVLFFLILIKGRELEAVTLNWISFVPLFLLHTNMLRWW